MAAMYALFHAANNSASPRSAGNRASRARDSAFSTGSEASAAARAAAACAIGSTPASSSGANMAHHLL